MQVMDKHLQILAQQHMETKFVKVDSPHHSHQCIKLRRNPNRQCFSHVLHIKLPRFYCGAAQVLCQNLIQPCAQIHAEKSPYLVEKLKIWMLPTLALIRQEKTVDYMVGFDDLGSKDDFTTEVPILDPPCIPQACHFVFKRCSDAASAVAHRCRAISSESGCTALA